MANNEKMRLMNTGIFFSKDIPGVELDAKRFSETFKADGHDGFGLEKFPKSPTTNLLLPAIVPRKNHHRMSQDTSKEGDTLDQIQETTIEVDNSQPLSGTKGILSKETISPSKKYLSRQGRNLNMSGLKVN